MKFFKFISKLLIRKLCTQWVAFFIFFAATPSFSQSDWPEYQDVLKDYTLQMDRKMYQLAVPIAQHALEMAVEKFGENDVSVAFSLNKLAFTYAQLGRYDLAIPLQHRALGIYLERDGENALSVATARSNLSNTLGDFGDPKAALELDKAALNTFVQLLGENDSRTATLRERLAAHQAALGDYVDALYQLKLSAENIQKDKGRLSVQYVSVIQNLASIYTYWGKFDDAVKLGLPSSTVDARFHPWLPIKSTTYG